MFSHGANVGKFVRDSKYNLQLSRKGPQKCIFSKIVADLSTLWDVLSDFLENSLFRCVIFSPSPIEKYFFGMKFAEG